ncbi:hypothetical protein [Burkholderia pyrrocinia]|uniref:Uncharacterized protein n=1 Tax=Burkholderia pyrrocinia TaxID=60550 RepID=A0ABZ3BCE0_BURPY
MKKFLFLVLTITFPIFVSAAGDRNDQIISALYSKLEGILGVGDYEAANGASMLILAAPGLPVDATLNPNSLGDRKKIVELFDVAPQASWIYRASATKISDVYQAILSNHEPALTSLTVAQKNQLAAAQKIIYKNSNHAAYSDAYNRYSSARTDLAIALQNVQDFQRNHPDDSIPVQLSDKLEVARDNFNLLGDKNTIIAAKATIDNLENLNPEVYWGALAERFDQNTFNFGASKIPVYEFSPSYPQWSDQSQSWTNYSLSDADIESHASSSHSSISGGVGGGWGLWSFGGAYGHSETATHIDIDGKDFSLQFELLRVSVFRPWMDAAVFHSQTWQWQPEKEYSNKLISDGADIDNGGTPKGLMPLLPLQIILARNVTLTAKWTTDIKNTFDSQTNTSVRGGWGPFSGSYNRTDSNSSSDGSIKISGGTITFPKPQVIGFLVEALPRSPDRLPGLKFASDQSTNVGGLILNGAAAKNYNATINRNKLLLESASKALSVK